MIMIERQCKICNKDFAVKPSDLKKSSCNFCSRQCCYGKKARGLRFWEKVEKTENCWLWVGAKGGGGYGSFGGNPKVLPHRYSYELHKGKIPKDKWVLHTCDNKKCINPAHLFLGDQTINTNDMVAKERQSKGEDRYNSKLTVAKVKNARERHKNGETFLQIADDFGVTLQCVALAVKRINWKHVNE